MARHMGLQMVRSATSAGANYQEARHAESRADFVHKVGIAAKEMSETLYWVLLLRELGLAPDVSGILREADELTAILVASARTARPR
jgi:four helix bundle protein